MKTYIIRNDTVIGHEDSREGARDTAMKLSGVLPDRLYVAPIDGVAEGGGYTDHKTVLDLTPKVLRDAVYLVVDTHMTKTRAVWDSRVAAAKHAGALNVEFGADGRFVVVDFPVQSGAL